MIYVFMGVCAAMRHGHKYVKADILASITAGNMHANTDVPNAFGFDLVCLSCTGRMGQQFLESAAYPGSAALHKT